MRSCSPVINWEELLELRGTSPSFHLPIPHSRQPHIGIYVLCMAQNTTFSRLHPSLSSSVPFPLQATRLPWLLCCATPTHPPVLGGSSPSLLSLLCSGQRNRASLSPSFWLPQHSPKVLCVSVIVVCVCVCMRVCAGECWCTEALNLLELGLQTVVNHVMWVLGTEIGSSGRTASVVFLFLLLFVLFLTSKQSLQPKTLLVYSSGASPD